MSSEKSDKTKISRLIVHVIDCQSPPDRFLEHDPKLDIWIEFEEKRIFRKNNLGFARKKESRNIRKIKLNRHEDSNAIPVENDIIDPPTNRKNTFLSMTSNL